MLTQQLQEKDRMLCEKDNIETSSRLEKDRALQEQDRLLPPPPFQAQTTPGERDTETITSTVITPSRPQATPAQC